MNGVDVNAELVRQGAAWVYQQYVKDQSLYALETEAKAAQRGLWSLPEAERTPPWEWRHLGHGRSSAPPPAAATTAPVAPAAAHSAGHTCGAKRYCHQMTSCEEAGFYLTQCGVKSLDGDGDGVPCETRCR